MCGSLDSIPEFLFSSNVTGSDVGNLAVAVRNTATQATTTHGYVSGGGPAPFTATIDRFSFASESTQAAHGNLSLGRQDAGSCHQ